MQTINITLNLKTLSKFHQRRKVTENNTLSNYSAKNTPKMIRELASVIFIEVNVRHFVNFSRCSISKLTAWYAVPASLRSGRRRSIILQGAWQDHERGAHPTRSRNMLRPGNGRRRAFRTQDARILQSRPANEGDDTSRVSYARGLPRPLQALIEILLYQAPASITRRDHTGATHSSATA